MSELNRRHFLRTSGLTVLPGLLSTLPSIASEHGKNTSLASEPIVKLIGDGDMFDAAAYLEQLQTLNSKSPIKIDRYGSGGALEELEKKFADITGKEKAIYMPSGTMANQFAITMLSGENTKVFVQDTSHVYRDEADAAQSVFNKRLMPLAKNQTYFTADELRKSIEGLDNEEVFRSGIGCVSIENPVRRSEGRYIPIDEIRKISAYCKDKKIKLHLDGARIYMASAWAGVSIKEYASYFDTVYISLYKYLGASGGAILCGETSLIEKMPHLIKIHGGSMFGNWLNAAMALHRLDGIEERLKESIKRSKDIFAGWEQAGIKVEALDNGTNIYQAKFPAGINIQKVGDTLNSYSVRMQRPDEKGNCRIMVNETLLYQEPKYIIEAMKDAIKKGS